MKKSQLVAAAMLAGVSVMAMAQKPSSAFDRGSSLQASQDPRLPGIAAKCRNPPTLRPPRGGPATPENSKAPPVPELPATSAIPGVLAAGQAWKVVWSWEGNNADGPIANDDGTILFANNDASNVMKLDPATGLASVVFDQTNTGGAVSRSKTGALFMVSRGIGGGVEQLEPKRRMVVNTFQGEPLECVGGAVNDLAADSRGGVYVSISGAGVFYADPQGVLAKYGEAPAANGIVLSPDEKILYITNAGVIFAFDVQADGSLKNQREFAKLRGGQAGDGAAVDAQGRVYATTGASVDVFTPSGEFLGSIPGPKGIHGVMIGGKDNRTLLGIVFYGGWGTPSARNEIVAIPLQAPRYMGRSK
ncbi:MAG: SMP-30/gluconolactonase/LRE family protein [Pseudomonadota bacterium]